MNKILVPTDFSPNAKKAILYACNIAKNTRADVKLLNVLHVPIVDTAAHSFAIDELMKEQQKIADEKLSEMTKSLAEEYGITVEFESCFGFAKDEIINYSEEKEIDFVVMGSKGSSDILDKLLGSVADGVVSDCKKPVLVVPGIGSFKGLDKVIYASDEKPEDSKTLEKLSVFLEDFDPEIHIVHVTGEENDDDEDEIEIVQKLNKISYVRINDDDNVDEVLDEYAKENNAKLIVTLSEKRNFFQRLFRKSVSKELLHHSSIPVLVFHNN